MGELWDAIANRFFNPKERQSISQVKIVQVRNTIMNLCNQYLHSPDDLVKFDMPLETLAAALEAINDPRLAQNFNIIQISDTMFLASLKVESIEL